MLPLLPSLSTNTFHSLTPKERFCMTDFVVLKLASQQMIFHVAPQMLTFWTVVLSHIVPCGCLLDESTFHWIWQNPFLQFVHNLFCQWTHQLVILAVSALVGRKLCLTQCSLLCPTTHGQQSSHQKEILWRTMGLQPCFPFWRVWWGKHHHDWKEKNQGKKFIHWKKMNPTLPWLNMLITSCSSCHSVDLQFAFWHNVEWQQLASTGNSQETPCMLH